MTTPAGKETIGAAGPRVKASDAKRIAASRPHILRGLAPPAVTPAVPALTVGFLVVSPTLRCFRKYRAATPALADER